uniref:Protein translocase subunit SecY n=1 Tax=Cryptomonas sp. CCAC 1634B TaxID=2051848 RepID=A0A679C9X8_9CRYP|nr:secY-type transporter protein [Cryptomonas sp. CCAC 1634B]
MQRRLVFTLGLVTLSRFGTFVPIPGVDQEILCRTLQDDSVANVLNILSSGEVASIGVLTLGIVPYINASILMQLGTMILPHLEKLQKEEGGVGKQRILQYTRCIAFGWSVAHSIGICFRIKPYVISWGVYFVAKVVLALTVGAMLVMWIGEQITEKGVGNGPSMLIFVNILAGLPTLLRQGSFVSGGTLGIVVLISSLLSVLLGIIYIQEGTWRIPVISAKCLRKGSLRTNLNYIPLKLHQGGVMPIILASAFCMLPAHLGVMLHSSHLQELYVLLTSGGDATALYVGIHSVLIVLFSFLYTSLLIHPEDISKNLRKMESTIPGVRPGKATTAYIQKTLNRLTFVGAVFLAFIAALPIVIESFTGISIFKGLGATSLLILVGVALDTSKQIQAYSISSSYGNCTV